VKVGKTKDIFVYDKTQKSISGFLLAIVICVVKNVLPLLTENLPRKIFALVNIFFGGGGGGGGEQGI
jgi:hypothetical protein